MGGGGGRHGAKDRRPQAAGTRDKGSRAGEAGVAPLSIMDKGTAVALSHPVQGLRGASDMCQLGEVGNSRALSQTLGVRGWEQVSGEEWGELQRW